MPTPEITRRTLLLAALSSLGLGGLAVALARMTLGSRGKFQRALSQQYSKDIELIAPRGRILDSTGRELATSRPAYAAYLGYPDYQDEKRVRQVCEWLGVKPSRVLDAAQPIITTKNYWLPVLIKNDLTEAEYTAIVEDRARFRDVLVIPHQVRLYPYGTLAAQLLGYTGPPDTEAIDSGISRNERIGITGLEWRFDSHLRGKAGKQLVEINSDFTPTGHTLEMDKVVPGQDLTLTIDAQLQYVAEQALARTLARIRVEHNTDGHTYKNANAGALIAMDPRTGAVLAIASHPTYDPNWFISSDDRLEAVLTDPHSPLIGRAWQTAYNPGSTWKALTSAAALREGVITPSTTVFCNGVYDKVGGPNPPHCWSVHGHVSVVRALAGSCDVFFYEMGFRLGLQRLMAMVEDFGFGKATGVDLPSEAIGWWPTEANRAKLAEAGDPWGVGSTIFAAIGQKVETSPLAIARYTCTLANGGKVLRPLIIAPGGDASQLKPDVQRQINVDPSFLEVIHQGMKAVTGPGGTAEGRFAALGVPVAGKTGTAEVDGRDPYGIFIAYAPADDPKVAVAIVGEQAGHGDSMIPAVKAVLAHALGISLPPTDEGYLPNATLPPPQV